MNEELNTKAAPLAEERAAFDAYCTSNLPQYYGPRAPTWADVEANVKLELWALWQHLRLAAAASPPLPAAVDEAARHAKNIARIAGVLRDCGRFVSKDGSGLRQLNEAAAFLASVSSPPQPVEAGQALTDAQIDTILKAHGWMLDENHDEERKEQIRRGFRLTLTDAHRLGLAADQMRERWNAGFIAGRYAAQASAPPLADRANYITGPIGVGASTMAEDMFSGASVVLCGGSGERHPSPGGDGGFIVNGSAATEAKRHEPDMSREAVTGWAPGRKLLRTIRDYQSARWALPKKLAVLRHRFWSAVSGADIPINCRIGGGLILTHPCGVVIHPQAVIGVNCLIFSGVVIGAKDETGTPIIGNGVDIGSGAKILGPVRIGDGARIGANAVVLDDVPAGATAVGAPARIVKGAR